MLVLRGISYPPSWGFEGTDLASLAHLECPTVCHGEPWREEDFLSRLRLERLFLRNPHSLPRASCAILFRSPSLKQAWTRYLGKVLRREGDSNPRNPFGVYTLSRRASSTTRASLLCVSN